MYDSGSWAAMVGDTRSDVKSPSAEEEEEVPFVVVAIMIVEEGEEVRGRGGPDCFDTNERMF